MAVQLMSNVKIITSGNAPTKENLLVGQAAFGKITSDGKYHLFGNSDGEVVDIVLSTYSSVAAITLDQVLQTGNDTTLDIEFKETAEGVAATIIGHSGVTVGTTTMTAAGFKDNGYSVLSANPANSIDTASAGTMRNAISVYSKSEVDAFVAGVFVIKGSAAWADLPTEGVKPGWVYNILSVPEGGVTDVHGHAVKVGDNVVYVAASEAEGDTHAAGWDVLSGEFTVDLSNYYTKDETYGKTEVDNLLTAKADKSTTYTKTEVDGFLTSKANTADVYSKTEADGKFALKTAVETAQADATQALADAAAAQDTADEAKAAVEALTGTSGDITTLKSDVATLKGQMTTVQGKVDALEKAGYQTAEDVQGILTDGHYVADENYVHTDNNYTAADKAKVDKIVTTGDGTKVLTDNGTYQPLEIAVISI